MGIISLLSSAKTDHGLIGIEDHYSLTANGKITNHIPGSRIAINSSITATGFVILASNILSQPTIGQRMNVVSSSINDSSVGTGAQQITIDYFTIPSGTTGWEKKQEIVTLNGITTVKTVNSDIYRIDRVYVNRVGSNGLSVGNITIKDTTDTLLFSQIDIGENIMLRAIHYVPKLYKCVLSDMMMSAVTNGSIIFRLFITEENTSGNTVTIGQLSIQLNGPDSIDRTFGLPIVVSNPNAKNISLGIAVKSGSGTQTGSATIRFHDHPI